MKKKPVRKANAARAKALKKAEVTSAPANQESFEERGKIVHGPGGELILMPHPDELLREADEEPNYRDLADYTGVIAKLREKGFSFRDIAEWLTERGVAVDHNGVYRVYTNNMTEDEEREEALNSASEEESRGH